MTGPALAITQLGFATTLQDRGRRGLAHLGVPAAGPVDRAAFDVVNRLVGNHDVWPGPATIETLGALIVEAIRPIVVARSTDASRHTLSVGERLRVDAPADGVWAYLAIRGGVDVAPVLGSRSHDTLSGLGPPPLRAGDTLVAGRDPGTDLAADHAPARPRTDPIRLWNGPQSDWFLGGRQQLIARTWTVSRDVSRVGVRLESAPFERSTRAADQLDSAGLVEGAIQVTPAGEPIVMLANHPTTGGYPVIAVVDPDDLTALVQARPGATIRFRRA